MIPKQRHPLISHPAYPETPHTLYRLYTREDVLLYVGRTCDLAARLESHRQSKSWWPSVHRHEYTAFATGLDAAYAESRLIDEFIPPHNGAPGLCRIGTISARRYGYPAEMPVWEPTSVALEHCFLRRNWAQPTVLTIDGHLGGILVPASVYFDALRAGRPDIAERFDILRVSHYWRFRDRPDAERQRRWPNPAPTVRDMTSIETHRELVCCVLAAVDGRPTLLLRLGRPALAILPLDWTALTGQLLNRPTDP